MHYLQSYHVLNKSVDEHIHNFRSHSQPNLNWDDVKELYRVAGEIVIGKTTWAATVDVRFNWGFIRN